MVSPAPWDGQWVADRLGVQLASDPGSDLRALVGLALRRNPKRAHLLVSHRLGKHVPCDPRTVRAAGRELGVAVRAALARRGHDARVALVVGFAETATGLGAAVADELDCDYLHSTRRRVPGVPPLGAFEEAHSHATSHLLLPQDPTLLAGERPVVLVDDELSTGRTALNTVRALHESGAHRTYLLAALVDVIDDRQPLAAVADELGLDLEVVALASGTVRLPDDLAARAESYWSAAAAPRHSAARATLTVVEPLWPAGVRDGGRHGYGAADREPSRRAADAVAGRLAELLEGDRVLVLGCEELMHAPTLIGAALADRVGPERTVLFSSTTRSPVVVLDEPGYPIRTALRFPSHDDPAHDDPAGGPGSRYAYNVLPGRGQQPFSDIVLIVDEPANTPALSAPGGLVDQLGSACDRLFLQVLPSYRPGGRP